MKGAYSRQPRRFENVCVLNSYAARDGDRVTHDALSGYSLTPGKLSVPFQSTTKFYTEVVQKIQTGTVLSLCVKVTPRFSLFFDIEKEVYLEEITAYVDWNGYLQAMTKHIHAKLGEFYPNCELLVLSREVGGADHEGKVSIGVHIYTRCQNIVVDLSTAKDLVSLLVTHLDEKMPTHALSAPWSKRFDISVYSKGLRLPGCRKFIDCPKCVGRSTTDLPHVSRKLKRKLSPSPKQRRAKRGSRVKPAEQIEEEVMSVCVACDGARKVDIGRVYQPLFLMDTKGSILDQTQPASRMSMLDVLLQFAHVRIEPVTGAPMLTRPLKPFNKPGRVPLSKTRGGGKSTGVDNHLSDQPRATSAATTTQVWKPIPQPLQKVFIPLILPSIRKIANLGDTLAFRAGDYPAELRRTFPALPYREIVIDKIISNDTHTWLRINIKIGPGSKHCANRWIQDKRDHRQNHIAFSVCLHSGKVTQTCFSSHCTQFRFDLLMLPQQTLPILRQRTAAKALDMIESLRERNATQKQRSKFYVVDEEAGNHEVHQYLNRTASQLSRLASKRAERRALRREE